MPTQLGTEHENSAEILWKNLVSSQLCFPEERNEEEKERLKCGLQFHVNEFDWPNLITSEPLL